MAVVSYLGILSMFLVTDMQTTTIEICPSLIPARHSGFVHPPHGLSLAWQTLRFEDPQRFETGLQAGDL